MDGLLGVAGGCWDDDITNVMTGIIPPKFDLHSLDNPKDLGDASQTHLASSGKQQKTFRQACSSKPPKSWNSYRVTPHFFHGPMGLASFAMFSEVPSGERTFTFCHGKIHHF